jgi:hypothetical protein
MRRASDCSDILGRTPANVQVSSKREFMHCSVFTQIDAFVASLCSASGTSRDTAFPSGACKCSHFRRGTPHAHAYCGIGDTAQVEWGVRRSTHVQTGR